MKQLFLLTILLGAFLLFQIQPLVGKITTPFFGGSAAVWTSCMFFFQTFLLVGYLYSHSLSKLAIKKQLTIHALLTFVCLLFLPVSVEVFQLNDNTDSPIISILVTLFFAIGMPYLLLATSVPMLQKWYSQLKSANSGESYYFYAVSNVGALVGLLSYPFIFEPNLAISSQKLLWSVSFLAYSVLLLSITFLVFKHSKAAALTEQTVSHSTPPTAWTQKFYWLALSATGVVLLLSITNAITQNIPPVPFLWILPLVIYLLTYILSFSLKTFYHRGITTSFFILSAICTAFLYHSNALFDVYSQLVIYSITLASGCMICHGELAKSTPKEAHLTQFYLHISLGGFFGGLFVSVIAPTVFNEYFEFPLGIAATMLLALIGSHMTTQNVTWLSFARIKQLGILAGLGIFTSLFIYLNSTFSQFDIHTSRNFYGTLSVKDIDAAAIHERRLIDGMTSHGAQSLDTTKKHIPLAYYSYQSGIGLLLTELKAKQALNMGIIGLGAGTLSVYGDVKDRIDYYELNPNVARVAKEYFSYLSDGKASTNIILGDGRLSLAARDTSQPAYNVLVIDAFSSDAIPKHLLTIESFQLYLAHLQNDGVLALHISNNYLDLLPVVKAAANAHKLEMMYFSQGTSADDGTTADWVLLTRDPSVLQNPTLQKHNQPSLIAEAEEVLWSDNFSSLLHIVK
ncbi:fused MFS/spermidine synthase [Pseudoalteromonas sp. T1lg65]|uniref:fused MFS/spermidine synthase n=1 Tax=Pseudoalteromonas sp. T1lg65 TaxID=2077101 RepID=UPI003F7AF7BB